MKNFAETDIIRHIYDENGNYIAVRPYVDNPDYVSISTEGTRNAEYFGDFEIAMTPEFARKLGTALIRCAEEAEPNWTEDDNS